MHFILISSETIDKITKFSASNPYSFNYLKSHEKLSKYGIKTIPITYFYDAKGELVKKHNGSMEYEKLKELIKKINK